MSIASVVEAYARAHPERPALSHLDRELSYGELRETILLVARGLAASGVRRGDVVAVLLHNSLEFVSVMLAAEYLGAVFMPLNWRLAGPELSYIVNHSGAVALVSEAELLGMVDPVRGELRCRSFVRLGPVAGDGWESFDELCARPADVPARADVGARDLVRLMYTSGTTARPKGVMITSANVAAKCTAHVAELGVSAEDRGLVAGPLYHVGALDLTLTTLLWAGAFTRILRRFDAKQVMDEIESRRVTTVWLAPAMVNMVLAEVEAAPRDLSSLRILVAGGEKMPLALIDTILTTFPNARFADAYGLTETVSGDTFLARGMEREKFGSVGQSISNVEIRIVDPDDRDVGAGELGEILLRGPKVCAGYWRDADATSRALRGGWLHTGDVGYVDEDGFLYIADRLKDVIISGGENIASPEIERVLYEHPGVHEAAVVGRPDPRWGEVPIAYVVPRDGAVLEPAEIVAFCGDRLAKYKVPKGVRVVGELPRTPSGKVVKRELRERELSLETSS